MTGSKQRMPKKQRQGLIAKIHVAKKQLALTDQNYRDTLRRVTGKESCADMTGPELQHVVDEFKRLGFSAPPPKRAGKKKQADGAQVAKVRAMWLALYHLGEVRDPSEEAMGEYVRRMAKIDDMTWMTPDHADDVIRGLRGWLERVGYQHPKAHWYEKIQRERALNGHPPVVNITGFAAKLSLMYRQCEILEIKNPSQWFMIEGYGSFSRATAIDEDRIDAMIERLGKEVRAAKQRDDWNDWVERKQNGGDDA